MADPRLHLLHLASAALPVGAYAYSQGLEYAIEAGWVEGEALEPWLHDGLLLGVAQLDLPILIRVYMALENRDFAAASDLNDRLLAHRETAELLLEDQQIGNAMLKLLTTLGLNEAPDFAKAPGYAVSFALACQYWKISVESALQGYCYSWLENQVTAATKLVPLGQSNAQTLLLSLLASIEPACERGRGVGDAELGGSLPGLALASCRHERQHTRLFRS